MPEVLARLERPERLILYTCGQKKRAAILGPGTLRPGRQALDEAGYDVRVRASAATG